MANDRAPKRVTVGLMTRSPRVADRSLLTYYVLKIGSSKFTYLKKQVLIFSSKMSKNNENFDPKKILRGRRARVDISVRYDTC